jgi:biotin transport system substrate-specific component
MNYLLNLNIENKIFRKENGTVKRMICLLASVVLLTIVSQFSIPLQPVPLTFQSTTVILIGMTLGPRDGTYVIAMYLIAGIIGLPVFEGFAGGLNKLLGPTCGYLIGFIPAAWVSGYLAQNGFSKNMVTSFIAAFIGVAIIFLFGIAFLSQVIGFYAALTSGFAPFIASEIIKLFVLATIIPTCCKKPF